MRKIIIIFICLALIGAGIGVGFYLRAQKQDFSIESILPQGPLVYVQLRDVKRNMEEVASQPFWQMVLSIDYEALAAQNILSAQQSATINLVKKQLSEVLSNPLSTKSFGQDVALVIYPPSQDVDWGGADMATFNPKMMEGLLSGFFLVTRIAPEIQLAEFVSRFFDADESDFPQGQVKYKS